MKLDCYQRGDKAKESTEKVRIGYSFKRKEFEDFEDVDFEHVDFEHVEFWQFR